MNTTLSHALKVRAHHLKPVILLGHKGVTESLIEETNLALTTHELIKIKLSGLEREEKAPVVDELCQKLHAECIQLIGNMATIYRKNLEKKGTSAKKTIKKSVKRAIKRNEQQAASSAHHRYDEKKPMKPWKQGSKAGFRTSKLSRIRPKSD